MERSGLLGVYAVRFAAAVTLAMGVSGCNGSAGTAGAPAGVTPVAVRDSSSGSATPIQHIVLVVQEARTFNNLWGTVKVAKARVGHGKHQHVITIRLKKADLDAKGPRNGGYQTYREAYDNGKMDGFYEANGRVAYEYVNPAEIRPYFAIAADYATADHMFQTQGSGDFTAHQDLIRGGTEISSSASVIDNPDELPWGCDAPGGTKTSLIASGEKYEADQGPFPCFTYDTLQTRLDPKSISWKYYAPSLRSAAGEFWNAFLAIQAVADNKAEWDEHISSPETNVLRDIAHGNLPAMSWVIPSLENSDHAGFPHDVSGPSWVASIVNAVGESEYWNSTAIVIVWDDWGGFYDPVPPKLDNQGGAGFRVPMLVVSAYTPQAYVSHTVYGFGSIIRFIEKTFGLKRLGTTDKTSTSIGDMFDFNQSPRQFEKIPSQ
ncbi:MAG TPA: alkaline phosphatase family protein [Candidatus Cybelea sp.]